MSLLPWKKSQQQKQLSAYLDGELDPQETLGLGEHLVFDYELRKTLADYARADEIVGQALAPATSPDAARAADSSSRAGTRSRPISSTSASGFSIGPTRSESVSDWAACRGWVPIPMR